jgi:putative ABC transport system permease protein
MTRFVALAFKNVFRNGKRSATLGVNYAIVALLLMALMAFARGATTNVSTSLVKASAGHITISGQYARDGRLYNGMLRGPEIQAIAARTLGAGTTVIPRYLVKSSVYSKGLSKRLSFTGIEPALDTGLRGQIRFTAGDWEDWAADANGVVMPADTAAYFGLVLGDQIVVSTRTRFGAFNTGILTLRGVTTTDNYFMKDLVLVHLPFLRGLDLAPVDAVTSIYVYLGSTAGLDRKRDALASALSTAGFEVSHPRSDAEAIAAVSAASTRYEADKEGRDRVMLTLSTIDEVLGIVRSVLAAVGAVGGLIAAVMLFVIAVSVFINLRMSVNERLREIGTMRAMGMEAGGVTGLFVLESSALALMASLMGAVVGAALSLGVRWALSLPAGGNLALFLDAGHLALEPRAADLALIVAVITVFAAAFSFLPARRGGRISPVEALSSTF